jgi:hypothetical protein
MLLDTKTTIHSGYASMNITCTHLKITRGWSHTRLWTCSTRTSNVIGETWVRGDLYTRMRLYLLHTYILYLRVLMLSSYILTNYSSSVSVNNALLRLLLSLVDYNFITCFILQWNKPSNRFAFECFTEISHIITCCNEWTSRWINHIN